MKKHLYINKEREKEREREIIGNKRNLTINKTTVYRIINKERQILETNIQNRYKGTNRKTKVQ